MGTFTNAKVLTVGLHIADVLGRSVETIPPGQSLTLLEEIRLTVAGTAAATAVDLARLGVRVASVGVVGDDALGRYLSATMTAEGVDVRRLRVDPTRPTSASMLPIRPDGSRPALHVIGATAGLGPADLGDDVLEGVGVLHLGGTCLMPGIDGAPSVDLLRRARERGVVVTMGFIPSGDKAHDDAAILPCLPYVDYLLPSDDDAYAVAGTRDRDAAIDYYLGHGVGTLLITMGGQGVSVSTDSERDVRLPAYGVDVVDTTGCGDAFSAGFIAGLVDGADVHGAVGLALACGSLVATGLGSDAGIVDRESVRRFQQTHASGVAVEPVSREKKEVR